MGRLWTRPKKTASPGQQEQEEELHPRGDQRSWPGRPWMPCRIPLQDALVAMVPPAAGQREVKEEDFPPVYEKRYFPMEHGTGRWVIPHDGGPYDASVFSLEPNGWDHTTCDACNVRLWPQDLRYVTSSGPYIELCPGCYRKHVARKLGLGRYMRWLIRTWRGRITTA